MVWTGAAASAGLASDLKYTHRSCKKPVSVEGDRLFRLSKGKKAGEQWFLGWRQEYGK